MKAGSYSPAPQLASLLPHHDDIKAVLEFCAGDEEHAPSLIGAIRRLMAGIIYNPNDAELWYDLSCAFGLWHLTGWKFILVAHRIDPENIKYLKQLAITYNHLGDCKQAIGLMNKALAIADKDVDRIPIINLKMRMETNFDDRLAVAFH